MMHYTAKDKDELADKVEFGTFGLVEESLRSAGTLVCIIMSTHNITLDSADVNENIDKFV